MTEARKKKTRKIIPEIPPQITDISVKTAIKKPISDIIVVAGTDLLKKTHTIVKQMAEAIRVVKSG
jgi:hypothetical protein